jgi:hypothetical protein
MTKKKRPQVNPGLPESFPLVNDERKGEDYRPTWEHHETFMRFMRRDPSLRLAEIKKAMAAHSEYKRRQREMGVEDA